MNAATCEALPDHQRGPMGPARNARLPHEVLRLRACPPDQLQSHPMGPWLQDRIPGVSGSKEAETREARLGCNLELPINDDIAPAI